MSSQIPITLRQLCAFVIFLTSVFNLFLYLLLIYKVTLFEKNKKLDKIKLPNLIEGWKFQGELLVFFLNENLKNSNDKNPVPHYFSPTLPDNQKSLKITSSFHILFPGPFDTTISISNYA